MAGRPAAPVTIVQADEILNRDAIIDEEPFNIQQMCAIVLVQDDLIKWLVIHRLLKNSCPCHVCSVPMSYINHADITEGKTWYCKFCKTRKSIRVNSFFTPSNLTLKQIVLIMYGWSRDFPLQDVAFDAGVNHIKTMTDWGNFIRDLCSKWVENEAHEIGGLDENGEANIIELDKTKFFR